MVPVVVAEADRWAEQVVPVVVVEAAEDMREVGPAVEGAVVVAGVVHNLAEEGAVVHIPVVGVVRIPVEGVVHILVVSHKKKEGLLIGSVIIY